MGTENYSIAIDLGASTSKMAAACITGNSVELVEVYTFPNKPLNLGPGFYWDIFDLYRNILGGLARFGAKYGEPQSVGIDTWGATYGFLDAHGRLAEPVFHYRDKRTSGVLEKMYGIVPQRKIFDLTGCQCASSYTLVQLYASVIQQDPILSNAKHLVLLPDLLAYFLGGGLSAERTIAGTTAMLEPSQRDWSRELLDALGIPPGFLLPLSDTGMIKGRLQGPAAKETGLGGALIVSAIGHDSAAAVAAIPGFNEDDLYVSIGTNVSMGIYRDTPALEEEFYTGGFKNTGGENGKIIIYRDFPGAWILNNLYAEWVQEDTALSYDDLDFLASRVEQGTVFDIEDSAIQEAGGSISGTITELIKKTGEPVPRVLYYASKLAAVKKKDFNRVWLISGAVRYKTLVSRIAGALGRPVYAGLPYASLTGNAVSQFYALGKLDRDRYGEQTGSASRFTEILPGTSRDWRACMERAIEKNILP